MMTHATTIQASPARLQGRVDDFVREYLQAQRSAIAGNPVFAPLYDDLVNYLARPGKRIRPLLFLHACEAFMPGEDVGRREFLSVAAAIEMLHGFILIHDDTIECPLVLAAILAGHNEGQIQALVRLAEPAGLAFQIQNDLQEFARFEISDADIPADFLEGKKTYLARMAFSLLNENDRGILQLCLNGVPPSAASVSKVRELVIKSGALEKSREKMHELFATASARARHPSFEADEQEGLVALIHLLGELTNGEVHRVYGAGR